MSFPVRAREIACRQPNLVCPARVACCVTMQSRTTPTATSTKRAVEYCGDHRGRHHGRTRPAPPHGHKIPGKGPPYPRRLELVRYFTSGTHWRPGATTPFRSGPMFEPIIRSNTECFRRRPTPQKRRSDCTYVSQAITDTPQQLIGEDGRYRVRRHDLSHTNLKLSPNTTIITLHTLLPPIGWLYNDA